MAVMGEPPALTPPAARGATALAATARRPPPPDPNTNRGPRDTDSDGIPDAQERRLGTNPNRWDSDGDNVSDDDEIHDRRSNPFLRDSDHDGLDDRTERDLGTDPRRGDSDRDGLDDLTETALGTDPRRWSSDKAPGLLDNGLSDGQELKLGTDPLSWDTDGDGDYDGYEVEHGDDPKHAEFIKTVEDFFLDDPVSTALGGVEARIASKVASRLLRQLAKHPRSLRAAETALDRALRRRAAPRRHGDRDQDRPGPLLAGQAPAPEGPLAAGPQPRGAQAGLALRVRPQGPDRSRPQARESPARQRHRDRLRPVTRSLIAMADYELDPTALGPPWHELGEREREQRFERFAATRPQRIEALRALVAREGLELGAGDEQLDALEHWYRSSLTAGPDGDLADLWRSVASDIGSHLSEVLRERHRQLSWKLWAGRKVRRGRDIHQGRPVLVGFPVPNPDYNVDLIGATLTMGRAVVSRERPAARRGRAARLAGHARARGARRADGARRDQAARVTYPGGAMSR
jgi:Bacterial TSP3 repeat